MARAGMGHLVVVAVATLALAGCEDGKNPFAKGATTAKAEGATAEGSVPATRAASSTRLVDRDVEAPEVFQVTDKGLWDGRPSLGGVWVASASAKDPERVIIRNPGNGKFVIGALFRRERDNPGPPIQISSDAAAALGLLAGQPGTLNITALRREEAPVVPPDASRPSLDTAETVASEAADPATPPAPSTGALDTVAVAAAIDKADGTLPAGASDTGADAGVPQQTAAADLPAPEPKKKWWQRKKKPGASAAPEPLAEPAAADTLAAPEVTAAPLPDPGATAAVAAAAVPSPAAAGKSLIQLGIFSVEENADRAAGLVKKAGGSATVRKEESKGKPYWSVVAGPANTAADREALLAKVKGLGFADAYFVSR